MEFTVKELAEKLSVPDTAAYGVIAFLESKGVIEKCGERKRPGGKGKPSSLYKTVEDPLKRLVEAFKPIL